MNSKRKQLSNPFSTGGGGAYFETRVQAAFAVLMLTGGVAPCLPPWPIKKIKLQGRHSGFDTDDLVVFVEDPAGARSAKLLVQVKHGISITKGNVVFGEVVQAAWNDFKNPRLFCAGVDSIALVTGPLRSTDTEVRAILEWARHSEDAKDFLSRVNEAKFSSKTKIEKLGVFRNQLKIANGGADVTDDQLWGFLKNYHFLGYDLDIQAGLTHSLLHSLIGQYSADNTKAVWALVVDEVQAANQNAGIITIESFSEGVRDHFQRRLAVTIPTALTKKTEPPVAVDWRQRAFAAELTTAVLLGGWDEATDGDAKIAGQLAGEDFVGWIRKIREVLQDPESPLILRNGTWTCTRKGQMWQVLGPRIFDPDLDVFQKSAVSVLSECDPMFELPPEERYMARVHRKVLTYSHALRKGLADTLALLGSRPKALTNCSLNKPETVALLVIREVFHEADWVLWGSLDNLLPLLAEAAPGEFLDAVETALRSDPCPFDMVFAQESSGLTGANYATGLLWALEALAWDADCLTRVVIILGELAARDPGGNWANRPANSLTTILLPWLPQTCATVDKRKTAVATLLNELPNVAWRILLSLLHTSHSISFRSHKPAWRETIPDDWCDDVKQGEYWEQVTAYEELAIAVAKSDSSKLADLIERLNDLRPPANEQLLAHLESESVMSIPEGDRFRLWTELVDLVSEHRKFADAKWAMKPEQVDRIAAVAEQLAPKAPALRHQRLFSERDFDLYEDDGSYENLQKELEARRRRAVAEVAATGGVQSVVAFAASVESPWRVGIAFGAVGANDADPAVLPRLLDAAEKSLAQFAGGFIRGRFLARGWPWVDEVDTSQWLPTLIGQLLSYLPFASDTWVRSARLLGKDESPYWTQANANPYEASAGLEVAVDQLIGNGRPYAAIGFLHEMQRNGQPFDNASVVRALLDALGSSEGVNAMDQHQIVDLIKVLQNDPRTNPDDLFQVEWAYLPLLDRQRQAFPKSLECRLANDPKFFCEVIRLVFRSKKKEHVTKEPTEQAKNIASNAHRLLRKWRTLPGYREDGSYDGHALAGWLDAVKTECTETGHLEVAMTMVGHALIHTPADPDGLWIHRSAAVALNAKDAGDMRDGFRSELFNSRGVYKVDPAGKPEMELAEKYRRKADQAENAGYQRLAVAMRSLADSYNREAERVIKEQSEGDGL